jgi:hypothetical protein
VRPSGQSAAEAALVAAGCIEQTLKAHQTRIFLDPHAKLIFEAAAQVALAQANIPGPFAHGMCGAPMDTVDDCQNRLVQVRMAGGVLRQVDRQRVGQRCRFGASGETTFDLAPAASLDCVEGDRIRPQLSGRDTKHSPCRTWANANAHDRAVHRDQTEPRRRPMDSCPFGRNH